MNLFEENGYIECKNYLDVNDYQYLKKSLSNFIDNTDLDSILY